MMNKAGINIYVQVSVHVSLSAQEHNCWIYAKIMFTFYPRECQVGLELVVLGLYLLSAGIVGVCHHTRPLFTFARHFNLSLKWLYHFSILLATHERSCCSTTLPAFHIAEEKSLVNVTGVYDV
jgi:hypothetical protein